MEKCPNYLFDSKWKYKKGTDSYICLVAKNTKAVSNAFEKLSGDNSFYELGNKCETSAGSDKVSISTKL